MNIITDNHTVTSSSYNSIDVSVVVTTYYHEEYIAKALDTILCQKFKGTYEIIIADDHSEDRTIDIVNEYTQKYPNIFSVYSNPQNLGISENTYNAYCRCRGKYIVSSAGDDYWIDDELLQKKYEFLEKNNDYFAAVSVVREVYRDGTSNGEVLPQRKYWGKEYTRESFEKMDYYQTHAVMIRNVFFTETGRAKFRLIPKFSRDLDDVTLRFFLFDFGRVHVDDNIGYAFLVRRESDAIQYNYNSKYKRIENTVNFINLLCKLDDYYNGEVQFKYWFRNKFYEILFYSLLAKDISLLKNIRLIPSKYLLYCIGAFPLELTSYAARVVGRNIKK